MRREGEEVVVVDRGRSESSLVVQADSVVEEGGIVPRKLQCNAEQLSKNLPGNAKISR